MWLGKTLVRCAVALGFACAAGAAHGQATQAWADASSTGLSEPLAGVNPRALAVDDDGYSYIVSRLVTEDGARLIQVWKYHPSGSVATGFPVHWPFQPTDNKEHTGVGVALDDYGNIYVLGMGPGAGAGSDIIVFKVTSTGQFAWSNVERRYDHDQLDDTPAVIIHYNDEIYVAGTVTSGSTGKDFVVIKWDLNGNIADGPETFDADDAGLEDTLADMVVGAVASPGQGTDHSGVWVTGSSYRGATAGYNYATMHYTFDLEPVIGWPRYFDGGVTGGNDNAAAMALGNHKVYVTGTSTDALGVGDYATVAYQRNDGADGWEEPHLYNGDANDNDETRRIAFEQNASVVAVTGKSWGGARKYDAVTVVIDASDSVPASGGTLIGVRALDGGVQKDDEGLDITVDEGSSPATFLMTGRYHVGTFADMITDRIATDGEGAWSGGPVTFDGWGYPDHAFTVRVGPDQLIDGVTHRTFFVLGRTTDIELGVRSGLVKYVDVP